MQLTNWPNKWANKSVLLFVRLFCQNWGLTGIEKWLIIDNKKWVFTVHLVTACSFLFLLPKCHTDIFCRFQRG